ncbi:MAG: peptidoglycan-binding protein [Rhodoferax sp.]|nr:peptidoglycan-binding protein [Rhodoferax sp.]
MKVLWVRGDTGNDVRKLRQALAAQLGSEAALYGALGQGDTLDADTEAAVRRWQSGVGLIADGVVGPYCQQVLGLRKPGPLARELKLEWVQRLFPATKPANISRYLPYVAAALDAMRLTDQPMVCAALATIRAESEGFLPISEFQSQFNTAPGGAPFALYDDPKKKLGNSQPGDGASFKGRGFVQLTGRANYETYGPAIGVDLLAHPDLANAPEVAACLLVQFLANQAAAMREDLAAGRLARARQRVNGGAHGLDRFRDVFKIAATVWPTAPSPAGKTTAASKKKAATSKKRSLTVRKDPTDLNDRAYLPPPVGLQEVFPTDADMAKYMPRYTRAGLILNQGQEGACTGFGLAGVVNYLRWAKAGYPEKLPSVSPRMFYNFARRYDEYAGENYEGSTCRGALKGWFNHGVCMEEDWPFSDTNALQPKFGYATRATGNTLGVYYRIDLKSITDMQAAIQAVGAIYVSAFTHKGWDTVPKTSAPPKGHAHLPVIAFDGRPSKVDGHAFALVGFSAQGFVVQNSWGTKFGAGGFAVLTYADWLANAMDAWVVAMGVPGVVVGRVSARTTGVNGRAGSADTSAWWSEDQAYQHSVVLGNDGRTKRYLTEDELSRTLLHQVAGLPDQWFRKQRGNLPKRLVIYAHGGLNSEDVGIARARAMGRHFVGNDCYPLFLVWKTGLQESIADMLSDAFRKQPAMAGGIGEAISEKTDLLVEKMIGRPLVRPIWSEMKENAELAFGNGRGGDLLITALQKLRDTWGDALEVHLVGHSAGSILLGHMLTALKARKLDTLVKSTHLFAPACTVQFANKHYAPLPDVMRNLYLHVLSDRVERNDNVAAIYRKSLLYMVSNALEMDLRTPLLGLDNITNPSYNGWDGASSTGETLKAWRRAAAEAGLNTPDRYTAVSDDKVKTAEPTVEIDADHGCFDNSIEVLRTTLMRIRGGKLHAAVDDLRGF